MRSVLAHSVFKLISLVTAVCLFGSPVYAATQSNYTNDSQSIAHDNIPREEQLLLSALEAIARADLDGAETALSQLLKRQSKFRLAQLVYADVLLARSGRLVDFGSGAARQRVKLLREEAQARLSTARMFPDAGNKLPSVLLGLAPSQTRAIVVDIRGARLYVFQNDNGIPRLEQSFYVSTGKNGGLKKIEGDQRTPVGVYFVTGRIAGKTLSDFYGPGALPVNYPNEWDLREGRTGYGIWIHGVPSDTFARSPKASDGCVALSNDHLRQLLGMSGLKDTPVIITNGIKWLDRSVLIQHYQQFSKRLEDWRKDWESLDVSRYSQHYSKHFHNAKSSYARWIKHKRKVNASKRYIRVALKDVSVFSYPGEADLRVVSFNQDYRSDNYSSQSQKRQYWQREADGVWRIIYEGPIELRPEHLRGIPFSARSRLTSLAQ